LCLEDRLKIGQMMTKLEELTQQKENAHKELSEVKDQLYFCNLDKEQFESLYNESKDTLTTLKSQVDS